jgi:ATP-dependent Clp protease protease subunit
MKTIAISGVIGWDVYAADIRRQLAEAGSEDIEVQIASPGGFVYDGLEIFNLLRRHPGAVTTRLMGMAASMASYIAMAGKRIVAEDNAVFMMHNPWGVIVGDQHDMRKEAGILDGFASILAKAYADKSGHATEDVREMMDAETYLFGADILDAGFADEIAPAGEGEPDKDAAVAMTRARVEAARKIVRDVGATEDLDRAAALLTGMGRTEIGKPGSVAPAAAAGAAHITDKEGPYMTLEELKAKQPDLYAAAIEVGRREAQAQVATLTAQVETLQKGFDSATTELTAIRAAAHEKRRTTAIEAALGDGRIKPVDRDFWLAQFNKDADGTEAILAKMPASPLFTPSGTAAATAEADALQAADITRLRKLGWKGSDEEIRARWSALDREE